MNKTTIKSNKSTLVAAALILTASTAVFGTMASESGIGDSDAGFLKQVLTEDQQIAMEEARELFKSGDKEAAKEIMEAAGIKKPRGRHGKMKAEFLESLSDEQREVMEKAHELFKSGDNEAAKELIEAAGIVTPHQAKHEAFLATLSDEQKEVLETAKALREAGDKEGAKALIDAAGIEKPEGFKKNHRGGNFKGRGARN